MSRLFKKRKWTGLMAAVLIMTAISFAGLSGCAATTGASPSVSPTPSASAPGATPSGSASPSSEPSAPTDSASPSASPTPSESATPAASPTPSTSPDASASPQPSDAAPSPSATSPSTDIPDSDYFGSWTVKQVAAYGDVGTYRQSDAEKLVGETLSFGAEKTRIITDLPKESPAEFEKPIYLESTITKDVFLASFKMGFDELGITADSVPQVQVVVAGSGGCTLLLKDAKTLILVTGGTYFELVKA